LEIISIQQQKTNECKGARASKKPEGYRVDAPWKEEKENNLWCTTVIADCLQADGLPVLFFVGFVLRQQKSW